MSIFYEENYVNHLDQEIAVGEPVVFITTGYNKQKYIETGVFAGVRKIDNLHGNEDIVSVVVKNVPCEKYVKDKVTGKSKYMKTFRVSTLPRARVYKINTTLVEIETLN